MICENFEKQPLVMISVFAVFWWSPEYDFCFQIFFKVRTSILIITVSSTDGHFLKSYFRSSEGWQRPKTFTMLPIFLRFLRGDDSRPGRPVRGAIGLLTETGSANLTTLTPEFRKSKTTFQLQFLWGNLNLFSDFQKEVWITFSKICHAHIR
jgi:hypothetical protein